MRSPVSVVNKIDIDKDEYEDKLTGFFFPDTVYRSENIYSFIQLSSYPLWFRLTSNVVRSDKLKLPMAKVLYEEFYRKRGLLVSFYTNKALAARLKVDRTTIGRMKKELIDGGFMRVETFKWRGKDFECFVMGEVQECGQVIYAFDICVRGYRSIKQQNFYYWPYYVVQSKTFIEFMCKPYFPLWFFLTANIIRGKFKMLFPNRLRKEFYDDGQVLPAYHPDDVIAEKLGVSTRTIRNMRKALEKDGIIKIVKYKYKWHMRPICILGHREMVDDKLIECIKIFEVIRIESGVNKRLSDFYTKDLLEENVKKILCRV
jgi:DNA-binding transcriptional regulator YhcF (GntR family)